MRAIACFAAVAAASLSFANILDFTFDTDNQGWQEANYVRQDIDPFSFLGPADWNPAGYLEGDDFASFAFLVSPDLGGIDVEAAYGETLTFDFGTTSPGGTFDFVVLASSTKMITLQDAPGATPTLLPYSYDIVDDGNWLNADGLVASEADIRSVLSNLSYIGVSSDVTFGGDDTRLDNVALVPEPGTMLVLGGGALVMALRRRRKQANA